MKQLHRIPCKRNKIACNFTRKHINLNYHHVLRMVQSKDQNVNDIIYMARVSRKNLLTINNSYHALNLFRMKEIKLL